MHTTPIKEPIEEPDEAHIRNGKEKMIETRLLAITSGPSSSLERMDVEHSYFRGGVDDAVIYYFCGYVIHIMSKHTECELCLHDISSTVPLVGSDAYLTTYRSFKEG